MKITRKKRILFFIPQPIFIFAISALALLLIHCTSNGDSAGTTPNNNATNPITPAGCVQVSSNPVANATSLGGNCVSPVLVDQFNGTVKDTANNLLWIKCLVRTDGSGNSTVWESSPGSCNAANAATVKFEVPGITEEASPTCNNLTYAGRSDWVLPDLKQLGTYYSNTPNGGSYVVNAAITALTLYTSPNQIQFITKTYGASNTAGYVDFSRSEGSGGGVRLNSNATAGNVTCVVKL